MRLRPPVQYGPDVYSHVWCVKTRRVVRNVPVPSHPPTYTGTFPPAWSHRVGVLWVERRWRACIIVRPVDHCAYMDTWGWIVAVFYHILTTNLVRVPLGTCATYIIYENVVGYLSALS